VKQICIDLEEQRRDVKAQIKEESRRLIAMIEQQRDRCLEGADLLVDDKKEKLREQMLDLQGTKETLKKAVQFSREAFQRNSDADLKLAEPHIAAQLKNLRTGSLSLDPAESSYLEVANAMTDPSTGYLFQTQMAAEMRHQIASLWTLKTDASKPLLHFESCSSEIWVHLFDNNYVAVQQSRGSWQWAMTNALPTDRPSWFKVKIKTLGHGAIIGLVGGGAIEDRAYSNRTAYGWASSGVKFCGGSRVEKGKEDPEVLFKAGDEPIFHFDPQMGRLKVVVRPRLGNRAFTIDVPEEDRPANGFRVLVNMFWAGDKVELATPTVNEQRLFFQKGPVNQEADDLGFSGEEEDAVGEEEDEEFAQEEEEEEEEEEGDAEEGEEEAEVLDDIDLFAGLDISRVPNEGNEEGAKGAPDDEDDDDDDDDDDEEEEEEAGKSPAVPPLNLPIQAGGGDGLAEEEGASATIIHTVLFKLPDIEGVVPAEFGEVVGKFNELPGIAAQFHPYGVGVEDLESKDEFMEKVDWPDKTGDYTHCLVVLANSTSALKEYLHSDEHLNLWMEAVKPYSKGIIVFDTVLEPDMMAPRKKKKKKNVVRATTGKGEVPSKKKERAGRWGSFYNRRNNNS
jgi:hypothetical protein